MVTARAAVIDPGDCPTCTLGGWDDSRARRCWPSYMDALDRLPASDAPVPDEPAAECWDCRRLRAAGSDPAALIRVDTRADGLPLHVALETVLYLAARRGITLFTDVNMGRWGRVSQAIPRGDAEELSRVLSTEHGFGVVVETPPRFPAHARLRIDPGARPPGASSEERALLIEQLAERAAAGAGDDAEERVRRYEVEARWSSRQTLTRLRARIGDGSKPVPTTAAKMRAAAALLAGTETGRRRLVRWAAQMVRAVMAEVERAYVSDAPQVVRLVERWIEGDLLNPERLLHAHDGIQACGTTERSAAAARAVKALPLIAYAAAGGIREGSRWGIGRDLESYTVDALTVTLALDLAAVDGMSSAMSFDVVFDAMD